MPNQPKTPQHSFRVDDELWDHARAVARANGETVADVLRAGLRRYVARAERVQPCSDAGSGKSAVSGDHSIRPHADGDLPLDSQPHPA